MSRTCRLRVGFVPVLVLAVNSWCVAGGSSYNIETVAGSALVGDGGPATAAQIGNIQGVAVDRLGNLYLSDTDNHRIRKVDTTGVIRTIAGTGQPGFSGDGGPATAAQLNLPYGLAIDYAGYLYIADLGNNRVRRIAPDGTINTYAGNGIESSAGDGGAATAAELYTPRNLAVDGAGNLYISEFEGHRVRKVTPDGKIATVAGTGIAGFRGDGGPANTAQLAFPAGVAVDRTGVLYIADSQNQVIRKILPGGIMATALGGSPTITLLTPTAIAVDGAFTIYVADSSGVVHAASLSGQWTAVAGTGAPGFAGDGGPAASASLTAPRDLALDLAGNLYIADGVRVRRVDGSHNIQTVAGDGYLRAVGDGGLATAAELFQPSSVALDWSGDLYIADTGTQRVRVVAPGGIIGTLAGTGVAGYTADGVKAGTAELNNPMGVAYDPQGNLWIADTYNHRVRVVVPSQQIATFAGTGTGGLGQQGLSPQKTALRGPRGVCPDRSGTLYIVDTSNHRVLRAPSSGVVETAAGNGGPGSAGDGGPAPLAQLNQPSACTWDAAGNLYIADTFNHRIRQVSPAGIITTFAGAGTAGSAGDEAAATAATLNAPRGVAVDGNGNVFIADTGNNRIRMVDTGGVIHAAAGQGVAGFGGDGGPAVSALLNAPQGLFLDGAGDVYVADSGNNRIRRLVPQAASSTAANQPPPSQPVAPALTVVNAASLTQGPVSPGEIVTVYGTGIGPSSATVGTFDASGLLANSVAGAEVRFDGIAASLFYAQSNQINAQVPYTVAGASAVHVEVFNQGQSMGTLDLAVMGAAPALFPTVVNQDGTFNGETAAAPRGTAITLYATGEGLTSGPNIAGQTAAAPYPKPILPVTLTIAGIAAQLLYAGSAPGFTGLLQIDAVVPGGFVQPGAVAVDLQVGNTVSPSITIWLQ